MARPRNNALGGKCTRSSRDGSLRGARRPSAEDDAGGEQAPRSAPWEREKGGGGHPIPNAKPQSIKIDFRHLIQIQTTKVVCEYEIPPPPPGATFDKNKVNVAFTNDTGVEKILQVPSAADCGTFGNKGWYYDDPKVPTKILVCPGTCTEIQSGSDAGTSTRRVDIILNCATEIALR
jgi:hypothetical protein